MKVKERVLILSFGFILLVAGLGVVYRLAVDQATWRPSDIYNEVGGSYYSSVSSSSSASDGVAVSMRSGMRSSRRRVKMPVFSNAHSASSVGVNAGSNLPSLQGGAGVGPLYTTSSHMAKSFGSGFATGTAAPAFVASSVEQPTAAVLSVPSLSDFSSTNAGLLAVNIQPSSSASAASAPMGLQGRRRIGIEDNYIGWLNGWFGASAEGLNESDLRDLYIAMTGDTDFANEEAWIAFWEWFQNSQSDSFAWKLLPLHDATWFVLLLCVMYAVVVYRKSRKAQMTEK